MKDHFFDKSSCAIIVPLHKIKLNKYARLSLRRLNRVLGRYDRFLIIPDDLEPETLFRKYHNLFKQFTVKQFKSKYFLSHQAQNWLRCSAEFYMEFASYRYILIHEIDALVSFDQLSEWCEKGYDYVGAPWPIFGKVGNGGFSLRRTSNCLRVIENYFKSQDASKKIEYSMSSNENKICEDIFWGINAIRWVPTFNVAPYYEALAFSFDIEPKKCYEQNNFNLPFGCHGWMLRGRRLWWATHLSFLHYLLPEFILISFFGAILRFIISTKQKIELCVKH